jgi:urate oxidase
MATTLGQNQYGKAESRVVKITREGATHHIKDLNVSIALSGDMEEVHYSGSNAHVLTTDTTKNTVYAFAKEHGIESAEQFGIHLARHFVTSHQPINRARIRVEQYAWERIAHSAGSEHSFVRKGQDTRTTEITYDGESWQVVSGLTGLTVMNSTDSEFWGYAKDKYTTLQETQDRILATDVNARWRFNWTDDSDEVPDWERSYVLVRGHLLTAFAETYSLSLQQTLYAMGTRVIDSIREIDEIRLSLPNKHHFLVDLAPFDLKNDNEVYIAADRPYGLIEGTVLRAGAPARIPTTD